LIRNLTSIYRLSNQSKNQQNKGDNQFFINQTWGCLYISVGRVSSENTMNIQCPQISKVWQFLPVSPWKSHCLHPCSLGCQSLTIQKIVSENGRFNLWHCVELTIEEADRHTSDTLRHIARQSIILHLLVCSDWRLHSHVHHCTLYIYIHIYNYI